MERLLLLGAYPSGLEMGTTGWGLPAMSEPRTEDRPIESGAGGGDAAPAARPPKRRVVWPISGIVIYAFLLLDFVTPYEFHAGADWRTFVLVGICIGQVNLIAAWAVLAPGNLVVRLPWSLLLTLAMWYALVLGNRVSHLTAVEDAILLVAVLLAGVTIAQVPLWIAKKVFGWRLIRGAHETVQSPQGPWQFNLQHLLLATFLLAVALAPFSPGAPAGAYWLLFPRPRAVAASWRRHRVQPAGRRSLYMGRTGIKKGHGFVCDWMAVLLRPSHVR